MGYYAFDNCRSLNAITIPDSVKVIEERTFQNCYSMGSVVLPEKIETIERSAFHNCDVVECIYLPEGLKKIDIYQFELDSKLNDEFLELDYYQRQLLHKTKQELDLLSNYIKNLKVENVL